MLPNCPQHVVAFYAVLRLGGIVVEHNPLYTPRELRHQFEDHRRASSSRGTRSSESSRTSPPTCAMRHVVSVDLTQAMPFATRALLRLPVAKARESREALTTLVRRAPCRGRSSCHPAPSTRTSAPPASTTSRSSSTRAAPPAPQGRDAPTRTSSRTPARAGRGCPRSNAALDRLRGPADVPRVRPHAVPHVRDEHGRAPRAVPRVRPGPRAEGREDASSDVPARRCADLRAAHGVAAVEQGRLAPRHPHRHLGAMPALGRGGRAVGGADRRAPRRRATAVGVLAGAHGNPVAPRGRPARSACPARHRVPRRRPRRPTRDVPRGERGELVVRGPQVFQRVLEKPEETEAVFVEDPAGGAPGSARATSSRSTTTASARSSTASRSSSSRAASTSHPARSRRRSGATPTWRTAPWSACPTSARARGRRGGRAARGGDARRRVDPFARPRGLTPYKVPKRVVAVDDLPRSLIGKVIRRQVGRPAARGLTAARRGASGDRAGCRRHRGRGCRAACVPPAASTRSTAIPGRPRRTGRTRPATTPGVVVGRVERRAPQRRAPRRAPRARGEGAGATSATSTMMRIARRRRSPNTGPSDAPSSADSPDHDSTPLMRSLTSTDHAPGARDEGARA